MADKLVDDLKLALGDAYTIERELTGGGMSRVFVAKEHALGLEVVIKVLPPDLAAGVNRDRLRQEVQLAARLSHPYIVPLLHAGEHGELLWFTMPYIAGESLRTRLLRTGPLKLPEVLKLLHDVVEALAYAHSRGVIHRDIKPGNILSDGRHALVTDFGVAKALNAALPMGGPGHTTSGMAIGTPAYMAPEQLAADPDADQRVDIYAVGLLAYELLSGESPFAAPSPTATMTAQLTRMPEPLHRLHAEIPAAFSDLIQHCLAKSPDDRPPDAQAVLQELDRIAGALAADVHRSTSGERKAAHASAWPLVLATVGVLGLVAGGFLWSQRAAPKASPRDSLAARVGGDTDLSAPLASRAMTHQDSLRIAEALRSELTQLDTRSKRSGTAPPLAVPEIDTAALARQLAAFDSVIKLRYGELRRGPPDGEGVSPPTPPVPGAATVAIGTPGSASPIRRVMLLAAPARGSDTTLHALEAEITAELQARLNDSHVFQVMAIDTSSPVRGQRGRSDGEGNRGGNTFSRGMFDSVDVMVFVSLQSAGPDSAVLRVQLRNASSGAFESRAINGRPVFNPASPDQFRRTINDVVRTLGFLRRLPPGTHWPQDSSVVRVMGPRPAGPYDPSAQNYRAFNPRKIDSLTKAAAETMRKYLPRTPRRDSLP
jgi:serine/threonine-protein kinase